MPEDATRTPRLALMLIPGLDHFAHDLMARLPAASGWQVRPFGPEQLADAFAWTDAPARDAVWFEFCWPPFPSLIRAVDFGGRRVIVRIHRIEACETNHVSRTPWAKVDDAVVVSEDMARLVRAAAPAIERTTRLCVIHNGLDLDRFAPLAQWDRFRVGWCGLFTWRKNPGLLLQVLHRLRAHDRRYHVHLCGNGGDRLVLETFRLLARRLNLADAIHFDGTLAQSDMPAWHAANGVLLSTSHHESFGYAIAEAAAVGCDLAVLDHLGAEEFWPPQTRFAGIDEAVWLIENAAPHRWRAVAERFSLGRQLEALAALLNAPRCVDFRIGAANSAASAGLGSEELPGAPP